MSATTVATWPTAEELTDALTALGDAQERVELVRIAYGKLIDVHAAPAVREGVEWPSLAALGAMNAYRERIRFEVNVLRQDVDQLDVLARELALDVQVADA